MTRREAEDRIRELEGQVLLYKGLARHVWALLSVQVRALLWEEAFTVDGWVAVDAAFDAATVLADKPAHHRVWVEPVRRILDGQEEAYVAYFPGGEHRHLSRAQLLMMGGQPPDEDQPHPPPKSAWQMRGGQDLADEIARQKAGG